MIPILALLYVSGEVTSFCQFYTLNVRNRHFHSAKEAKEKKQVSSSSRGYSFFLSAKKKEASYKNFDEFLTHQECDISSDSLTAVTFASPFCGPCKRMKEELVAVKKSMEGIVNLVAIDSNKYPALSCRYNITDLPCTIIFKCGTEVHRIHGIQKAKVMIEEISPFVL